MIGQYIEICPKKTGTDNVLLTNGDLIHTGGEGTVYAGQWFFSNHSTKYIRRLPKSNNLQEALEEYQQETGNCIVNADDYNKETK
jgi:hypothetical protein